MPRVKFVTADGTVRDVSAPAGYTLMEAAVRNDIPGILAQCGGACSCATCHVHVSSAWFDRLPVPELTETYLLEAAPEYLPTSRLSCQIRLTEALEGLVVHVPGTQG